MRERREDMTGKSSAAPETLSSNGFVGSPRNELSQDFRGCSLANYNPNLELHQRGNEKMEVHDSPLPHPARCCFP